MWSVHGTNATSILSEGDIEYPMERIFNSPMLSNRGSNAGTVRWQATEIELNFVGGFIP